MQAATEFHPGAGISPGLAVQKGDCARSAVLRDMPARSTPARDVMTSKVICVAPDDSIEECVSLITHKRIRHLPVLDSGKLVGMIALGDVVRTALAEKNSMIEQLENYIVAG